MAKIIIDRETLYSLYINKRMSLNDIAKCYNCSNQTILNRLREHNIQIRSVSDALKNRKITWKEKIRQKSLGKYHTTETKHKQSKKRKNYYKNSAEG